MKVMTVDSMDELDGNVTYEVYGYTGTFRFSGFRTVKGEKFATFTSDSEGYKVTAFAEDFEHGIVASRQ